MEYQYSPVDLMKVPKEDANWVMNKSIKTAEWLRIYGDDVVVPIPREDRSVVTKYYEFPNSTLTLCLENNWHVGGECRLMTADHEHKEVQGVTLKFLDERRVAIIAFTKDISRYINVIKMLDSFKAQRVRELEGFEIGG